ncbi:unnamed protein product [Aphanomyces euteiches]
MNALRILPLENATMISSILLSVVDLATSVADSTCLIELTSPLLSVLPHFHDRGRGTLHLLLALETLVLKNPTLLWESDNDLLGVLAFLLASLNSPLEQRVLLRLLRGSLQVGVEASNRVVYAEVLIAPLLALLPDSAPHLLLVQEIVMRIPFNVTASKSAQRPSTFNKHWPLIHLLNTAVVDPVACSEWIQSCTAQLENSSTAFDPSVVNVVCALLFHPNATTQVPAIALAKSCILKWPLAGRHVVPCVIFLLSRRDHHSPEQLLDLLHVLIATAKDTECMKTIIKTLKALADVQDTKALALRLLYHVWTLESRIYPRLEEMLAEDYPDDTEWQVCQLYTIYQLCQTRGDLGLNFVARIQGALEHALPSMAAMALACVRALCVGDCLDFAAACKIIATKLRKKKITCVDHPLHQEELCALYGIGGAIASDKPAFLDQLWEFTTSPLVSTRLAAWKALNEYSLHLIGLKLLSSVDLNVEPQASDETDLEAAIDNVLVALTKEEDATVRQAIHGLLERVGEDEAKQPRKRFVAERTSGGATREMRNLLPHHSTLRQMYNDTIPLNLRQALAGAVLTSYVYVPPDDSLRKRKDKLVKHMETLCDEVSALRNQLQADAAATEWPLQLAHLCGSAHFMHEYVSLVQEKVALVINCDNPSGSALEQAAIQLIDGYTGTTPTDHLMLGAVARFLPSELHVISNRMLEQLLRSLRLSLSAKQSIVQDVEGPSAAIIALGMATQGALGLHENRVEEVAEKLLGILFSPEDCALAPACILAIGHVVQSLMLQQNAPELMTRLWHVLLDQLLTASTDGAPPAHTLPVPTRANQLTKRGEPDKARITAAITALSMASEGCLTIQRPEWLSGLHHLFLDLHTLGFSEPLTGLPVILLECLKYDLIGWTEIEAFVTTCVAAMETPQPEALIALPYLLCRTQALGHSLSDLPQTLIERLELIAQDSSRQFDATSRSYATLGLANLMGVGLGIEARPTTWKGLLVSRIQAERVIKLLTQLAALCPLQRVRIHAAWALGALSALGTTNDNSFQIKNPGMDAGLQLPSTTLTYKLLDRLRQLKNPEPADASWIACAFAVLAQCQIPTFHYATMVQRFLKARLGDQVALACLSFSFGHCVQDPSLLSFLLELTEVPRFRQLNLEIQQYFFSKVATLTKLVAPHQLHKILVNLNVPQHLNLVLDAIAACAQDGSTPAIAACASVLLDDIFPRLVAAGTTSIEIWNAFAKTVSVVDRKQGKTRFVEALKDSDSGFGACVCLMELFRLGGCEPKEVRSTLPFLASTASHIEPLVLHIAACLRRLQPNDQLLWMMDIVNWIGLSLSRDGSKDVLLLPLLAALCMLWSPQVETHAQWLLMGQAGQVQLTTLVLHASFVQVLVKLKTLIDSKPITELLAQLVVLIEQVAATHAVYEQTLMYAYIVQGLRIDALTEHFGA